MRVERAIALIVVAASLAVAELDENLNSTYISSALADAYPDVNIAGESIQTTIRFSHFRTDVIYLVCCCGWCCVFLSRAGLPKCGSSFFYYLLSRHPDFAPANKKKEFCGGDGGDVKAKMAGLLETLNQQKLSHPGRRTVNGCINIPFNAIAHRWMLEHAPPSWAIEKSPKYIITARDPADRLWGSFNFWRHPLDTNFRAMGSWATPGNYRTPELFHELVLAGSMIEGNWLGPGKRKNMRILPLKDFLMLSKTVGRSNLIILDIDASSEPGTLSTLAAFLGIDDPRPLLEHVATRVNSGATLKERGAKRSQKDHDHEPGTYEISGFRPVLNKTRAIIYADCFDDCVGLAAEFGVRLERCIEEGRREKERKRGET